MCELHRLGIDCVSQLEWRSWQPGTEYPKNLYIKNVSLNSLKLTYRQSNSKAFTMDFAEAFTLRPGMSTSIKVGTLLFHGASPAFAG